MQTSEPENIEIKFNTKCSPYSGSDWGCEKALCGYRTRNERSRAIKKDEKVFTKKNNNSDIDNSQRTQRRETKFLS